MKPETLNTLYQKVKPFAEFKSANQFIFECSGIENFFWNQNEFEKFITSAITNQVLFETPQSRRDFGDFQTPGELTDLICSFLKNQGVNPTILIEPTFGTGSFILSALKYFPGLKQIFGIEIFQPYVWQTRQLIFDYFLHNKIEPKARINLVLADFFKFDFTQFGNFYQTEKILILGNPPWITNAELSLHDSKNLPQKSNFRQQKGFEALTGASNFDLGESVLLKILENFSGSSGWLAMLVKDAVIKNLVHDLPRSNFRVDQMMALKINARKYFKAAVPASLFKCNLNAGKKSAVCAVGNLNGEKKQPSVFGWVADNFVSDAEQYQKYSRMDGACPFIWRQGVKHDCAKIMEFTSENGFYVNGFNQKFQFEPERIFGLIKSSDLKQPVLSESKKFVLLPQLKLGDETMSLANDFPKIYDYLTAHQSFLEQRKSKIYHGMPPFSIFGIGDYSFKPYKVAISGFYQRSTFSLLLKQKQKALMLDDTCYFLGFESFSEAAFVWGLLNGNEIQNFLPTLVFKDAKRPYTKRVLMRIALAVLIQETSFTRIKKLVANLDHQIAEKLDEKHWDAFRKKFRTLEL